MTYNFGVWVDESSDLYEQHDSATDISPPAPQDLTRVCAFRHDRVVSNDNVVQWQGRRLQIPPQQRRFSFAGAIVQLYQALDGRVSLYYGDTRLEHTNASRG